MQTTSDLKLTDLETSFINTLIPLLYAEPGFTDCELKDISKNMGISIESGKGILGSLTKKGIIETDRVEHYDYKKVGRKIKRVKTSYELIIFHPDYYFLRPGW